jgi:flagellar protein FliO/FliZ
MFETLFGSELPLPVRFFLAFLIVLGLIGAAAWAVRRFGSGRLGGANARGRQPRLGVIDYASVDARRRLILVRRDNVEHLLMIGGPTDVVVEANIVRAVAANPRDVTVARSPAMDSLPRAIPLPENGNGSWPLQPEPMTPPAPRAAQKFEPAPKFEPLPEEPAAFPLQPAAETSVKPQRDTLAALADELSTKPAPAPFVPPAPPARPRSPLPSRASQTESRSEPRAEPRQEPRPEPRLAPAPPSAAAPVETAAADQSLAEMAHRLEAALRKPGAPAPTAPAIAMTAPEAAPPAPAPRSARSTEPKAAVPRADIKPNKSTTLYENLEQEMASLLGRPTNKN